MRIPLYLMAATLFSTPLSYAKTSPAMSEKNAYAFSFHTLQGHHPMPLSAYRGKVLLIVNTASQCGFTPQFKGLEALYQTYQDKGLVVIGVPANDFGGQEPGSSQQIATFCQKNYGVTFPMTEKVKVTGKNAHPFYLWARAKLGWAGAPKWNFHKYLVGRDGELIQYFYSTTSPEAPRLKRAIETALKSSN